MEGREIPLLTTQLLGEGLLSVSIRTVVDGHSQYHRSIGDDLFRPPQPGHTRLVVAEQSKSSRHEYDLIRERLSK